MGGQWGLMPDAAQRRSCFTSARRAARERERVRWHLLGAEQAARRQSVALDPQRAQNRALLLDELRRYRRRGRFPLNHECPQRAIPVFVDEHGTRCAVAHLMDVSGQGDLVRHIAATRNFARVRELARLPELRAWLTAAGLSVEEAARIQPEYCDVTEAEVCFCGSGGLPQVVVGTIVEVAPPLLVVRVDRIDGPLAGVAVGDEVGATGEGVVGQQLFFAHLTSDSPASPGASATLYQASGLVIREEAAYCQVNPDTAGRPVTVDTAIEALRLTDSVACVNVLGTDDSDWYRSRCEYRRVDSESGCSLSATPSAALGSLALTSAAVFAALAARRYRRGTREK